MLRGLLLLRTLLSSSPRTLDVLNLGLTLSPWALLFRKYAAPLFQKYIFADWQFFGFLLVLIGVDTVTGILRSWKTKQISSRGFSRVFLKLALYLLLLVLAHVMTSFTVHGEKNLLFQWFDTFIYCAMMAREALSVLENVAAVEPRLVPKRLLKRLALFQDDPEAALREIAAPPIAAPVAADPAETLSPVNPTVLAPLETVPTV